MGISLAAAAIGSAVIGGGASIIAGNKSKKAINKATDAQTAAAQQSIALQREIYGQNREALNPFQQTGINATNQINALLGLPAIERSTPQGNALLPFANQTYGGYGGTNSVYGNPLQRAGFGHVATEPYGGFLPSYGIQAFDNYSPYRPVFAENQPQATQATASADPRQAAEDAFQVFRDSTGYQFGFNEGQRALHAFRGAQGTSQSGAAYKDAIKFGNDYATYQGFTPYLNALQGQQNIGFGAASAQAGVGQNFANNVTNLNTGLANSLGNAAIAQGNVSANTIGGIGSALGGALGFFSGSSFGGGVTGAGGTNLPGIY